MLLVISGKMGSGKSTISKELVRQNNFKVVSVGSEIKPLADLLINDRETFIQKSISILPEGKDVMQTINKILSYFDENFKDATWEKSESGGYVKNKDYRLLLQDFPMIVREHFGDEVFARLMISKVRKRSNEEGLVCDDIRLLKEKSLMERYNYLMIRFDIDADVQKERLLKTYGEIDEKSLLHPTETALDNEKFDLRINVSYKSVEEIVGEVQEFLYRHEATSYKLQRAY